MLAVSVADDVVPASMVVVEPGAGLLGVGAVTTLPGPLLPDGVVGVVMLPDPLLPDDGAGSELGSRVPFPISTSLS